MRYLAVIALLLLSGCGHGPDSFDCYQAKKYWPAVKDVKPILIEDAIRKERIRKWYLDACTAD